jgi:hypothetical protein
MEEELKEELKACLEKASKASKNFVTCKFTNKLQTFQKELQKYGYSVYPEPIIHGGNQKHQDTFIVLDHTKASDP